MDSTGSLFPDFVSRDVGEIGRFLLCRLPAGSADVVNGKTVYRRRAQHSYDFNLYEVEGRKKPLSYNNAAAYLAKCI